ncbi:MAG: S41 family peptidase [Rhodothermales bacterium]
MQAPLVVAQPLQNAGFESPQAGQDLPASWRSGSDGIGGYEEGFYLVARDTKKRRSGQASLRIERIKPGQYGTLYQTIPREALRGLRIRLRGYIATRQVTEGQAGMWIRMDNGPATLSMDLMMGRGPSGDTDWQPFEMDAPIPPEATAVAIGVYLMGGGTAWYDDLELDVLTEADLPATSDAATRYVNQALDAMEQYALRRDSVDWPQLRLDTFRAAAGAQTPADTYPALRYALGRLGDRHSHLIEPMSIARDTAPAPETAPLGRLTRPRGERLDDRIGYLWLPTVGMAAPAQHAAFADTLQTIIAALAAQGVCRWVLDLRDNDGGNMWPMLAGIGPLTDADTLGAMVNRDGSKMSWWYADGTAGLNQIPQLSVTPNLPKRHMPVAILQGPRTASSGEIIAVSFIGQADARSFGAPTAGLSTGNTSFTLSDGAIMNLTTSVYADRTGRTYGGPIAPDVAVAEDATMDTARAWLLEQGACDR